MKNLLTATINEMVNKLATAHQDMIDYIFEKLPPVTDQEDPMRILIISIISEITESIVDANQGVDIKSVPLPELFTMVTAARELAIHMYDYIDSAEDVLSKIETTLCMMDIVITSINIPAYDRQQYAQLLNSYIAINEVFDNDGLRIIA